MRAPMLRTCHRSQVRDIRPMSSAITEQAVVKLDDASRVSDVRVDSQAVLRASSGSAFPYTAERRQLGAPLRFAKSESNKSITIQVHAEKGQGTESASPQPVVQTRRQGPAVKLNIARTVVSRAEGNIYGRSPPSPTNTSPSLSLIRIPAITPRAISCADLSFAIIAGESQIIGGGQVAGPVNWQTLR